jgi:ankyrin repeat protein
VLNLLLNEAEHNYDVLSVNSGGDTLIHLACKYSTDIQILESLLIKLRTLVGDKEKIQEFLALQNKDGLKAFDYCVFKNRHDMAAILREFVETSQ